MLKSMTGFGRHELVSSQFKIIVEMKSVNHRYLDINMKMPKKFNCFESDIRKLIKGKIQRGKVDFFLSYETEKDTNIALHYNATVAESYMKCFQSMKEQFPLIDDISVSMLANFPEVLTMERVEESVEELWDNIQTVIETAMDKLIQARIIEGEHLKQDLLGKLERMLELVQLIEERSPEVLTEYRTRLEEKVKELLEDSNIVEDSRILTEVTIFADKICVDEEVVRLKSHIVHMRDALQQQESIGRKMDFLAQEMNREANTILSKSNDMQISDVAIELKTEIEKVREQIQNIE